MNNIKITNVEPQNISINNTERQEIELFNTYDITAGSGCDIELITEIYPESIEEDLKDNQVYNGNAIHDLARLFGMTIQDIGEEITPIQNALIYLLEKEPLIVTATFTLSTQSFGNISHYYDKIKQAYDEDRQVRLIVTITENGNLAMADMSILDVTRNAAFFYPIMKTNIGNGLGEQIYFFDVKIGKTSGSLTPNVLQSTSFGE